MLRLYVAIPLDIDNDIKYLDLILRKPKSSQKCANFVLQWPQMTP